MCEAYNSNTEERANLWKCFINKEYKLADKKLSLAEV